MTLRFVIGRAGKGKSNYIYNEIYRHIQAADTKEKLFLVVPEQYTLQAERDFMERTGLKGIMQLEVLSFSRLAQRVFAEVGGLNRVSINEQGRNMVLRRVLDEIKNDLQVYRDSSGQNGFLQELLDFLAGLKQRAVTLEDMDEIQKEARDDSLLSRKLQDLALIYERFNAYLKDRYIDNEDYINLFIERMSRSSALSGGRVWVDNFATFSPQTVRVLEELIQVCRETTISITMNSGAGFKDEDIFELSRRSFNFIKDRAAHSGIATELIKVDPAVADQGRNAELLHLERELYAYPSRKYLRPVTHINAFAAPNPDDEVEDLAIRLISLARDQGLRWKEVAVICNDLESYGGLVKRIFTEYGIPFFMDEKKDIMDNPIIQFIMAVLQSVERNYMYEDVFRCLKTGLGGLDEDACERLENYVLEYGIRGKAWKEDFTRGKEEELADLNRWREAVITPLEELKRALAAQDDFAGITRVLYDYLEGHGVTDKLEEWIDELWKEGMYATVREYSQIWKLVVGTFDQMAEILGEQQGSLKDYLKVLEAGLGSHEVGIIPTTVDQVLVGNVQRSKSHNIRVLFVLGVNDGIIPSRQSAEGVLSGDESQYLAEKGLDIAKSREMQVLEESFLIYNALSKCRHDIYFSYASSDGEGRALRPSLLLERLSYLFPELQIESGLLNDKNRQLKTICRPQSTLKYLIENVRLYLDEKPVEDLWGEVFRWYQQPPWQEGFDRIWPAFSHRNQVKAIDAGLARKLYNSPVRGSVTRLERFIACPFAHFVQYGLSARERKEFTVQAPDIGELLHKSLLNMALEIEKRPGKWQDIKQAECEAMMETVMEEMLAQGEAEVFRSNSRYRYLSRRLKRIGRRAAGVVSRHIQAGGFTPLGYEIEFGSGRQIPALLIELGNGERMYLEGRIDRIDVLDSDEASYVRIIDYKTGAKKLSLADTYYGLNLQLLIYLKAVLGSQRRLGRPLLKPGGIFYFKIDDPLIESEDEVREVIEQHLIRELKLKGLVLKDVKVVRAMDRGISAVSDIIPVGLKQDESFYANSSVLSEEDFDFLLGHVDRLLTKAGAELLGGKVKIEPYRLNKQTACDYCSYLPVCQFDRQLPGNRYRNLPPLSKDDAIRKMSNHNGGELI